MRQEVRMAVAERHRYNAADKDHAAYPLLEAESEPLESNCIFNHLTLHHQLPYCYPCLMELRTSTGLTTVAFHHKCGTPQRCPLLPLCDVPAM